MVGQVANEMNSVERLVLKDGVEGINDHRTKDDIIREHLEDMQQQRDALGKLSEEVGRAQHESEMKQQRANERCDKLEKLARTMAEASKKNGHLHSLSQQNKGTTRMN